MKNPDNADSYQFRAYARGRLGDKQGACLDYKKAASLGGKVRVWLNSSDGEWCKNLR